MHQFDLSDQKLSPLMIKAQAVAPRLNYTNMISSSSGTTQTTNHAWGTAFESGVITSVPPAATFLSADASFVGLSLRSMKAIQTGSVLVSGSLFQRTAISSKSETDTWSVVSTSRTEPLSIACYFESIKTSRQWVCYSPAIMDILFSMPGSAILSGGELRINILFSYAQTEKIESDLIDFSTSSHLHADDGLRKMLQNVESPSGEDEEENIVLDIVGKSEFTIRYTNPTALTIDVWGRLLALTITVSFTVFWLWSLGFHGWFSCVCCGKRDDDSYEIRQGRFKFFWLLLLALKLLAMFN